jgi:hypothetical protein
MFLNEDWDVWPQIFRWEHGSILIRWAAKPTAKLHVKRRGGVAWFIYDGKRLIVTKSDVEKDIPRTYYDDKIDSSHTYYPHGDESCIAVTHDDTGNTLLTWRGKTFESMYIYNVIFEGTKIFAIANDCCIVLNHDLVVLEEVPYNKNESYPVVMSDSLILFLKDRFSSATLTFTRMSKVYLNPRYQINSMGSFDCHFNFPRTFALKFV